MEELTWKEYCKQLQDAFDGTDECKIPNDNKECDAAVNLLMLKNCNNIYMFCKKMSVFRDGFYDDENYKNLKSRKTEVREALAKFFKKVGSRLVVIVAEKPGSDDFILKDVDFKDLVRKRKILIYQAPKGISSGTPHFTVADDAAVRIENNDEEKSATCFFHNNNMTANCKHSFETFRAHSSLISY